MGAMKGFIPSRFVNDIAPVEAALADFLKAPKMESLGPEWNRDQIASDVRFSS